MAEPPSTKSRRMRLPAWLLSNVVLTLLLAGFLTTDRLWLHWYFVQPDVAASDLATLRNLATDAGDRADRAQSAADSEGRARSSDDSAINLRISSVESSVQALRPPASAALVDRPEFAIRRVSDAVAILSLIQGYGGFQTTSSAQGRACTAYLMKGLGSVTDCGFRLVD